jgi:hypothetical protein
VLVSEIYTYALASLDSDSVEMPNTLLQVWFAAAEGRMYEALQDSRYYQQSEQLTASGTSPVITPTKLDSVDAVIGPFWELRPIPQLDALARYPLNRDRTAPKTNGSAIWWSQDPNTDNPQADIWLWPNPPQTDSFILRGTRALNPTGGDINATPDFPTEAHPLIGEYLVARGYEFQQNMQVANAKMARFEGELDILERKWTRVSEAAAVTIGGRRSRYNAPTPGGRLRFPFDF